MGKAVPQLMSLPRQAEMFWSKYATAVPLWNCYRSVAKNRTVGMSCFLPEARLIFLRRSVGTSSKTRLSIKTNKRGNPTNNGMALAGYTTNKTAKKKLPMFG